MMLRILSWILLTAILLCQDNNSYHRVWMLEVTIVWGQCCGTLRLSVTWSTIRVPVWAPAAQCPIQPPANATRKAADDVPLDPLFLAAGFNMETRTTCWGHCGGRTNGGKISFSVSLHLQVFQTSRKQSFKQLPYFCNNLISGIPFHREGKWG